jgi:hypothetical protein
MAPPGARRAAGPSPLAARAGPPPALPGNPRYPARLLGRSLLGRSCWAGQAPAGHI